MVSRKPVSWFLTERGRNFSFALIAGTGIVITTAKWAPQTLFLYKYKEFVQQYENGKPLDLSQELQKRCEQCLDILKVPDVHKSLITPFRVFGYDLFHAGSQKSKYGVAVGIPVNFTYKTKEDLKKDDIQVNQKSVDWESETGKKLADALILPERVQQFALCREILMSQNYKFLLQSAYPFATIFFVYTMSQLFNARLKLYTAPAMMRGVMYSIFGMFGLGTYLLLNDATEVHYETVVDKQLCEINPDFIECGVIFYEKIMQRNQALRELMGREGERKYSKLGNENYGIRHPRLTLMHRKQFFEDKLKETQKGKEDIKE